MEKYELTTLEKSNEEKIKEEAKDLVDAIVKTNDVDKLNEYINLFNVNKVKKNIIRTTELDELLSLIDKQAIKRFKEKPDEFSNKDVIDYMKATQDALNQTKTQVSDIPPIQINKQVNNININSDELDKESKEKVYNILKSILSDANSKNDSDVIDITTEANTNDKG